ncbi:hypothetical protein HK104_004923 [Borealophlyctis nickersoniae]|nr:hypothetical protein HK104_004923 [Borealophlyctis nickersoniae]
MPHIGPFSVTILIDNVPAEEYAPDADAEDDNTRYIEAKEGARFLVQVRSECYAGLVSAWLYVDGVDNFRGLLNGVGSTQLVEGRRITPTAIQPFIFAPVQLVEDGESNAKQTLESGTIRVEFRRAIAIREEEGPCTMGPNVSQVKLNEKSKKGALVSHTTKYGAPVASTEPRSSKKTIVEYIDKEPMMTFVIKYRSHDYLDFELSKQTPQPVSPAHSPRVNRAAKREASPYDNASKRVKRERTGDYFLIDLTDDDGPPRVTRLRTTVDGAIDLTED